MISDHFESVREPSFTQSYADSPLCHTVDRLRAFARTQKVLRRGRAAKHLHSPTTPFQYSVQRRPRIVLIDDDDRFRRGVVRTPELAGFDVFAFQESNSALECIGTMHVDALLIDIYLDGIDGLEVLRKAKQATPNLPVVMMTASMDIRSVVQATEDGAGYYLEKPFTSEQLIFALRKVLSR